MENKIVHTQSELESALKGNAPKITIAGPYAEQIGREWQKRHKKKKIGKAACAAGTAAIAVASVAAAPFTGGTSLAGLAGAAGFAAAAGLTVGTVTISTTELAVLMGIPALTGLGMYGLSKGYDMEIKGKAGDKEGTVILTRKK